MPKGKGKKRAQDNLAVLARAAALMDAWLDANVSAEYKGQPLAQDWARVTKVAEELGQAVEVLIDITGQNPRKPPKGYTKDDLVTELADVALTAIYAIRHFQGREADPEDAVAVVVERCAAHVQRLPPT